MKLFFFCFLLFNVLLQACSTSQPSDQMDVSKLKKGDLKTIQPLPYNSKNDYLRGLESSSYPLLLDEGADSLPEKEQKSLKASSKAPLTELAVLCHKNPSNSTFQKVLDYNSRYRKMPSFWTIVGNCFFNINQKEKAQLFYNKALELKPDFSPALNNIGVLLKTKGRAQKALLAFREAEKKDPFAKTPKLNLIYLYLEFGLTQKANNLLLGMLQRYPSDQNLLLAHALVSFFSGNLSKSQETFEKLDREQLLHPYVGLNYAYTLILSGKKDQARKVLEKVQISKKSKNQEYFSQLMALTAERNPEEK